METKNNTKKREGSIAARMKRVRAETLYQGAAKEFGVNYNYVCDIAGGYRKCDRGKAKGIKEWLEERVGSAGSRQNENSIN